VSRYDERRESPDRLEREAARSHRDSGEIEPRATRTRAQDWLALPCPWPGEPERRSTIGEVLADFEARGTDRGLAEFWIMGARLRYSWRT
jgi:hypothetical protein